MRSLLYVPVLHTPSEVGCMRDVFTDITQKAEAKVLTKEKQEEAIKQMWDGIREKLMGLKPDWTQVRIFQDAMPVSGQETAIASRLAEKGSLNHQLLLDLLKEGAILEGTENPELLVEEYDSLLSFLNSERNEANTKEYKTRAEQLLEKRDQFIAARIQGAVKDGEGALAFMGVRHKVDKLLVKDFLVSYVIYRLPFQKVGEIYQL